MSNEATSTIPSKRQFINIRQEDEYNTKRIFIQLPLICISTMDTFSLKFDIDLDIDGLIISISIPYLRIWIGKKVWHRYSNLLSRKTLSQKRRIYE